MEKAEKEKERYLSKGDCGGDAGGGSSGAMVMVVVNVAAECIWIRVASGSLFVLSQIRWEIGSCVEAFRPPPLIAFSSLPRPHFCRFLLLD
jgi:hypothetical protein